VRQGDEVAGRYRLEELQGHGPMSEVWRAHDDTLDRTVALKILSPTADLERFRREARVLAELADENVMRVYDYGEDEAGPFMALEWLPGGTLEQRLAHGPLPPDETRRVATGMATGLARLHSRGLVHRDLKPANVLFDEEGRVKLGDFGLARRAVGPGTLTDAGTVLGTAAYISPEQAAGEPAGPASDVYSFGVILFRMLTGRLPFVADEALALVEMHRNTPAPAVETLEPEAPADLAALTAAALRKVPAQRPANGQALLVALGGAAPTIAIATDTAETRVLPGPGQAGLPETPARWSRRRVTALALALLLLAGAGGVLAWIVTRPGPTAPAGISSSSGARTKRTSATSTTAPSTSAPSTSVGRSTTARTTTRGTTTVRISTGVSTTVPATTTLPTTTLPTTTLPTTSTSAGGTTTGVPTP
jgi:eukaryotic-like serine/threonine-protein kinase